MNTTETKPDRRVKMYFRCDPDIRRRFKAAVELTGETTMEAQAARLMSQYAERVLNPEPEPARN